MYTWGINPFIIPACNISGWKVHTHACKQYIFWSFDTSTFNAMRFDENPSRDSAKTEDKKA